MKSLPNWRNTAVFKFCLLFVWLMGAHPNLKQVAGSQVADNSSWISIDCGAKADYVEETSGIWYQTDEKFIENGIGKNYDASPDLNFSNAYVGQQLKRVRSFPEGHRNCYTLKPKPQNNSNYLIRALFAYANYDNKNELPTFDLYLGPNFWTTVRLANKTTVQFFEIIHVPMDIVQVCLVNTGQGTPFISALELRLLNSSMYSTPLPLSLQIRVDAGTGLSRSIARYKDDVYDRLWIIDDVAFSKILNTTIEIETEDTAYEISSAILRTASEPVNVSNNFLYLIWKYEEAYQYYVYLHFAEIQKLPTGRKRIVNVSFDDNKTFSHQPLTLEYLKPVTISSKTPTKGYASLRVEAAAGSDAPPILNAFEIYQYTPQPISPTDAQDVNAITGVKFTYGISRNWQGDPCLPSNFAWDGLNCSSDNNSRIISLNLSSSNLKGQIAVSFASLKKLESLDLSNNELSGQLPEFLADLPNLKLLNLSGNRLSGSIPESLRKKTDLQLSVANNPDLCQKDSCKEYKFLVPLITSFAAVIILVMVSLIVWRLRKKKLVWFTKSQSAEVMKQKNQVFSYSQVLHITNNFETILGEGGFGKVYLGTLEDNTQVAIKLLSPSSQQGYKEFKSEAQLLSVVHHKNLVSLVGYCYENNVKALIYEYMDNGDLSRLLSEKNPNVLKWNERLQIAVDAAKGLDYLHNGCKTPIIHRDLKPSNILLNKSMVAKIADFGLSRAFTNDVDTHLSTQPAGTPGYMDPEFQRSGILNKKSDIYSFGVILLQLITGQPPIRREPEKTSFILDWVRPKIDCGDIQGTVDPRLAGEFSVISAWKAVEIAMSCILPESTQRPDISHVLQEVKECLALEMDHARTDKSRSSSSLNYASITSVSAR